MNSKEWSEAQTLAAETLWLRGDSCSEIGRAVGMTKNAVVGKAHRMRWPARPAPHRNQPRQWTEAERQILIDRPAWTDQALVVMLPGRTAAAILSKRLDMRRREELPADDRPPSTAMAPSPAVEQRAEAIVALAASTQRLPPRCNWLDGDLPRFVRCEAPAVDGKNGRPTYCLEHFQRVYQRVQRRGYAA